MNSAKKKRRRRSRSDNNVGELYYVENHELPVGALFTSIEDIRNLVNLITTSPEWQAMGNIPSRVRVFDWGENEGSEASGGDQIWLCRKHWHLQAVLHELAHIATPKARHGAPWVRAYLLLIHYFMGSHYVPLYTKAFKRIGVKL